MEMTISDYVDISKTHYTDCICDVCIQVRKWNRDIVQNEIIARNYCIKITIRNKKEYYNSKEE